VRKGKGTTTIYCAEAEKKRLAAEGSKARAEATHGAERARAACPKEARLQTGDAVLHHTRSLRHLDGRAEAAPQDRCNALRDVAGENCRGAHRLVEAVAGGLVLLCRRLLLVWLLLVLLLLDTLFRGTLEIRDHPALGKGGLHGLLVLVLVLIVVLLLHVAMLVGVRLALAGLRPRYQLHAAMRGLRPACTPQSRTRASANSWRRVG
jgi:hypothetical protein